MGVGGNTATPPGQPRDNVFMRTMGPLFRRGPRRAVATAMRSLRLASQRPARRKFPPSSSRDFRSPPWRWSVLSVLSQRRGHGVRCKVGAAAEVGAHRRAPPRATTARGIQPRPRLAVKPHKRPPGFEPEWGWPRWSLGELHEGNTNPGGPQRRLGVRRESRTNEVTGRAGAGAPFGDGASAARPQRESSRRGESVPSQRDLMANTAGSGHSCGGATHTPRVVSSVGSSAPEIGQRGAGAVWAYWKRRERGKKGPRTRHGWMERQCGLAIPG